MAVGSQYGDEHTKLSVISNKNSNTNIVVMYCQDMNLFIAQSILQSDYGLYSMQCIPLINAYFTTYTYGHHGVT